MLASSIPYKFATPWATDATSGYVNDTIPATASGGNASQQLGFPPITAAPTGSGGLPPNIADFNGLGLYATLWSQLLQAGGPIGYDATFSTAIGGYPKGAVISSATFPLQWLSTADNNTSDPDTGGANWQIFPLGLAARLGPFLSSNTTLTAANWGQYIDVGNGITVTLPTAASVSGMPVGFLFGTSDTSSIAASGGGFVGGGLTGTSVSPTGTNSFLSVQSDGSNWRVISCSPDLLTIGVLAGIAGDFSYTLPGGFKTQVFETAIVVGAGLSTTAVTLPVAFATECLGVSICFGGTTPPGSSNPGSIAVARVNASEVNVTGNFLSGATLGVTITAWGH